MSDDRKMLRVGEVAEELGIKRETVSALIRNGHLRALDVGSGANRCWRIDRASLEDFCKARTSGEQMPVERPKRRRLRQAPEAEDWMQTELRIAK